MNRSGRFDSSRWPTKTNRTTPESFAAGVLSEIGRVAPVRDHDDTRFGHSEGDGFVGRIARDDRDD